MAWLTMSWTILLLALPLGFQAGRLGDSLEEGASLDLEEEGAPDFNYYCEASVPSSVRRNKVGRDGHDCKCPQGLAVTGASRDCESHGKVSEKGRKFSPRDLTGKGCYCRPVGSSTLEMEDGVLATMLEKGSEEEKTYALVQMAGPLISSELAKTRARRMGFLKALTQALKGKHLDLALEAMSKVVSKSPENANEVCGLKAVKELSKMLSEGDPSKDDFDKSAKKMVTVLRLLVEAGPESKARVMDDGGLDAVFQLLDAEEMVAQEASDTLLSIAVTPATSTTEGGSGDSNTFIITKLAQNLQDGGASNQGKKRSIQLIDTLALDNADTLSKKGLESNVIAALVSVFKGEVKGLESEAALTALRALTKLAGGAVDAPREYPDRRKATILKTPGVLDTLLDILSKREASLSYMTAARNLLKLLMSYGSDDVIEALITVLKQDNVRGYQRIHEVVAMGFEHIKRGLKTRLTQMLREGATKPDPEVVARLLQDI